MNPLINYALVKKFYADPALEVLVCYSTMIKASENIHFANLLITSRFPMLSRYFYWTNLGYLTNNLKLLERSEVDFKMLLNNLGGFPKSPEKTCENLRTNP